MKLELQGGHGFIWVCFSLVLLVFLFWLLLFWDFGEGMNRERERG